MNAIVIKVFSFECDARSHFTRVVGDGAGLEFNHGEHGITTMAEAKTYARSRGWRFHRNGTLTCPVCAGTSVSVVEG